LSSDVRSAIECRQQQRILLNGYPKLGLRNNLNEPGLVPLPAHAFPDDRRGKQAFATLSQTTCLMVGTSRNGAALGKEIMVVEFHNDQL
jgi:hypothetical protein